MLSHKPRAIDYKLTMIELRKVLLLLLLGFGPVPCAFAVGLDPLVPTSLICQSDTQTVEGEKIEEQEEEPDCD